MNTIYLVRHGENKANLTKEFSYRKVDYPLTPKGVIQAQQTAAYFPDKAIHAIYTSPLKRAQETAQMIAQVVGVEPIIKEEFREINVGTLEGQPPTQELWTIHNNVIKEWFKGNLETAFPDGENFLQVIARMRAGLTQVMQEQPDKNVVIVGHGGIFSASIAEICADFDRSLFTKKEYHNCAITTFELHTIDGKMVGSIKEWASHTHMRDEAAELVSGFIRTS